MASRPLRLIVLGVFFNLLFLAAVNSSCLGSCPASYNVPVLSECLLRHVNDPLQIKNCCYLIDDLSDTDAAVCLCNAIKMLDVVCITGDLKLLMNQCAPNYSCNDDCPF